MVWKHSREIDKEGNPAVNDREVDGERSRQYHILRLAQESRRE